MGPSGGGAPDLRPSGMTAPDGYRRSMADRPAPRPGAGGAEDEAGYDWLYSVQGKGVGSVRRDAPDPAGEPGPDLADPEPTRMLRRPTAGPPAATERTSPTGTAPRGGEPPSRTPSRTVVPAPPPREPRARRRFRWRWLLVLLGLWLGYLVVVPLYAWTTVDKVDAAPRGDRPGEQPGTTYLVVGSDARAGLAGQRTDTIMLLHTGSGPNLLMSVPRDSQVDVPGHGTTKINAAFAFGGPKLLVRTVEQNTGIRVDHYVEIGFTGLVGLVDAAGGIEICPKTAMQDELAGLDIDKGCQEVDGKTALAYARSRHTSELGDIDRARHQREVVSAIGREAVGWQTVVNPVRYWRVNTAAADSVRVDEEMGPFAAARFAVAMTRVDGDSGLTCGVPIVDLAVTWDPDRAPRLFTLIAEDRTDEVGGSLCRPSGLAQ